MRSPQERSELRRRFLDVDTANVADVLDAIGLGNQGLAPPFTAHSGTQLGGWAYTIDGHMTSYEGTGDEAKMQACEGLSTDEVAVWAGDGHGVCFFGELIALGMMEQGCVGALVDGGVRDLRWLDEHGFAVFARYRTPVQSIGRWRVTEWQTPVSLPGATTDQVRVEPGDFILGDQDGVITIPDAHVETVLTQAEAMSAKEAEIRAALSSGLSLTECLERFGHV